MYVLSLDLMSFVESLLLPFSFVLDRPSSRYARDAMGLSFRMEMF